MSEESEPKGYIDGKPPGYAFYDLVDNDNISDPEEKDGVVVVIEEFVKEPFISELTFFNKIYTFKRVCKRMKDGTCFCVYNNPKVIR